MSTRTIAQLALLVIGLIVWGYGTRVDDERLRWVGIACFAGAFLLRLLKKRDPASS
jgi:hypothetical protein